MFEQALSCEYYCRTRIGQHIGSSSILLALNLNGIDRSTIQDQANVEGVYIAKELNAVYVTEKQ